MGRFDYPYFMARVTCFPATQDDRWERTAVWRGLATLPMDCFCRSAYLLFSLLTSFVEWHVLPRSIGGEGDRQRQESLSLPAEALINVGGRAEQKNRIVPSDEIKDKVNQSEEIPSREENIRREWRRRIVSKRKYSERKVQREILSTLSYRE